MNHNGRYAEAIGKRTVEFNGMTPRELAIYLSGQSDGANIKADECQVFIGDLEEVNAKQSRQFNGVMALFNGGKQL